MAYKNKFAELVQPLRTDYNLNQVPSVVSDPSKLSVTSLIDDSQLTKICDYLEARTDCVCFVSSKQLNDKNKDGHKKLDHVHIPIIFSDAVDYAVLARELSHLTGARITENNICKSTDNSNASIEKKFLSAAAYAIHAFQPYSGNPSFPTGYYWDGSTFVPLSLNAERKPDVSVVPASLPRFCVSGKAFRSNVNTKYLYWPLASDFRMKQGSPYGTYTDIINAFVNYRGILSQSSQAHQVKVDSAEFLMDLCEGKIKEYEMFSKCSPAVYLESRKHIPFALEYAYANTVVESRDVIFIQGESGVGKTTYAKAMAEKLGYKCYITSTGKNLFDDYRGEECIIMDDFRDNVLPFNEVLKVLDNNTPCKVSARYYNKYIIAKLIIITSSKPFNSFYKAVAEKDAEQYVQLARRVNTLINMTPEAIHYFKYDSASKSHTHFESYENTFDPASMFGVVDYDAKIRNLVALCDEFHGAVVAYEEEGHKIQANALSSVVDALKHELEIMRQQALEYWNLIHEGEEPPASFTDSYESPTMSIDSTDHPWCQ